MGLLRLLLAIAVLLQHVSGCTYVMTGGAASVQTFYIISGFLIALILDVKYNQPRQLWLFYSNRGLRIYSTYWLFLVASILLQVAAHVAIHHSLFDLWRQNATRLGLSGSGFLVLSNLFIFGQDLTLFLALGQHGLHWTTHFWSSTPILPMFLLIAPAWSLSLELTFYLLAPWMLRRRTSWIIGFIMLSFAVRLAAWQLGLRNDPWSYRFFPSELGLFLAGAMSYRLIYRRIRGLPASLSSKVLGALMVPAVVFFPLYDHSHGVFFSTTKLLYFAYAVLAIPLLFRWTGTMALDRRLGDLSYPLYLCHFNVVQMLNSKASHVGVLSRVVLGIVLSCAIAYLSFFLLERPLDRFRQARIRGAAGGSEPLALEFTPTEDVGLAEIEIQEPRADSEPA